MLRLLHFVRNDGKPLFGADSTFKLKLCDEGTKVMELGCIGFYSKFDTKTITGVTLKKGVQVMRIYFDYAEYNMGSISVINEISAGMIQPRVFGGKLIIYPSPVHDNLFISGINSLERYTIFDVYGQVLLEGNIANNEFINVNSLKTGNYLIKFKNINEVQTKIFTKL